MGKQAHTRAASALGKEANGSVELRGCIRRKQQRPCRVWRLAHLLVAVRSAEPVEVQCPDIETSMDEGVPPRAVREPVRDRQRGGERRAMHVKNRAPMPGQGR